MQQSTATPVTARKDIAHIRENTVTLYRIGYTLSFLLIGIGIVIALVRRTALSSSLPPLSHIIQDMLDLHPNGFIGLGIGVMILTPIVMTIQTAISFFGMGDRRFGLITSVVAAILLVTIGLAFL